MPSLPDKTILADQSAIGECYSAPLETLTPGEALDLLRQLEQIAGDAREYVPVGWTRP